MEYRRDNLSFLLPLFPLAERNTFSYHPFNVLYGLLKLFVVHVSGVEVLLQKVRIDDVNYWPIHYRRNGSVKVWFYALHVMVGVPVYLLAKEDVLKHL